MKLRMHLVLFPILWIFSLHLWSQDITTSNTYKPIPRSQAFFGLHFDLHPGEHDTELGADITEENIEQLLHRVKPDYVQYDCKGHAGWTGYPTKVGWASPGIVKDSLAIWREVTRRNNVGLFIHYSGVWDSKAIVEHPDWASVNTGGKPSPNNTSTFSPYVDELLIPQLQEVSSQYKLDGFWVDGECWATELDYSPAALEAWKEETGFSEVPKKRGEPNWLEWKMFHRRQFERYLKHWVDALHQFNPGLQITSNWMYTTFAPKPVDVPLDFISGDYSHSNSVARAQVDARYLANTGMPWDLMAWGFSKGENLPWSWKPAEQLQQEAAVVLMQGGGFQIYYQPTRAGQISETIIKTTGQVADFCRARQAFSHKSISIPQVALLLSTESMWDSSDRVFAPSGNVMDPLEGALQALLERHYSVDVLAEHQLQPRLSEFPLVVIPDTHRITDEFKNALLSYVEKGGHLLLLGEKSARLFQPQLGVNFEGDPVGGETNLAGSTGLFADNGAWQKVIPTSAEVTLFRYPTRNLQKGQEPAATVNHVGQGKVAAIYGPVAQSFHRSHHPWLREAIGELVEQVFPDPAVEVLGPPTVDIALRKTSQGQLSVHLLNRTQATTGERYAFIDHIPPAGSIALQIQCSQEPQRVLWQPEGISLDWKWKDGVLNVTVPQVHIHGAIVID